MSRNQHLDHVWIACLFAGLLTMGCGSESENPNEQGGPSRPFTAGLDAIGGGTLTLSVTERDSGDTLCTHTETFDGSSGGTNHEAFLTYYSEGDAPQMNLSIRRDSNADGDGPTMQFDAQLSLNEASDELALPSPTLDVLLSAVTSENFQMSCGTVTGGAFDSTGSAFAIYGSGDLSEVSISLSNFDGPALYDRGCASAQAESCVYSQGFMDVTGQIMGNARQSDGVNLVITLDLNLEGVNTTWKRDAD